MTTNEIMLRLLKGIILASQENFEVIFWGTKQALGSLYAIATKHDLAHLVAHGLEEYDIPQNEEMEKFQIIKKQAVYRYLRLDHRFMKICITLENAEIPFIPLKGSVLREYYPEPWMRTSCDIDILVKDRDLEHAIEALTTDGWVIQGSKNYHDVLMVAPDGIHLELHFHIKQNFSTLDRELEKVWEYAKVAEGKRFEYRMDNTFFVFHILAHMVYHFLRGGCGVRPLLDLWILKNQMNYDEAALEELCKSTKIDKFYENVNALISVWFENGTHTEETRYMEKVILTGGVYGSFDSRVILDQANAGSRKKHVIRRIFMPYCKLKTKYPILEKHKWLMPLFQIIRWIRVLINGRIKYSIMELKQNNATSNQELQEAEEFLKKTGLYNIEYHSDI